MSLTVDVHFDGGCMSKPTGRGASGAVVRDVEGRMLGHVARDLPVASNNVAEWTGLLIGLEAARDLRATRVRAFGDSNLVVQQFSGAFGVNNEQLQRIGAEAWRVANAFSAGVEVQHVPRELNRAADAICTAVLHGVYVPEAELEEVAAAAAIAELAATPVEVGFVVEIRMSADEVREAVARGVKPTELRKYLAKRYESRLMLAVQLPDGVKVSRVKG
jgi:ribonuclease HI